VLNIAKPRKGGKLYYLNAVAKGVEVGSIEMEEYAGMGTEKLERVLQEAGFDDPADETVGAARTASRRFLSLVRSALGYG
jgi:hypothetical protein